MVFDDEKALLLQRRQHRAVPCGVLKIHHAVGLKGDGAELLLRGEARDILFDIACAHLVLQGGHADHIEFVQIGAHDA